MRLTTTPPDPAGKTGVRRHAAIIDRCVLACTDIDVDAREHAKQRAKEQS
jgi:hypothetical protein